MMGVDMLEGLQLLHRLHLAKKRDANTRQTALVQFEVGLWPSKARANFDAYRLCMLLAELTRSRIVAAAM